MKNYNMPQGMRGACGCEPEAAYRKTDFVAGMAYVPWQYFDTVYETDKALEIGTIFPELNKPFLAEGRGCRR